MTRQEVIERIVLNLPHVDDAVLFEVLGKVEATAEGRAELPASLPQLDEESRQWLEHDISRLGDYGRDAHEDLDIHTLGEPLRYDPIRGWVNEE